jgi:uncharacterized membrane protein YqiK
MSNERGFAPCPAAAKALADANTAYGAYVEALHEAVKALEPRLSTADADEVRVIGMIREASGNSAMGQVVMLLLSAMYPPDNRLGSN